ncbi:DUF4198 domain-containing protein [Anatilimnocola floriformis]|uniref:DUF4198 domain-containing protein n=1 Tax=Anatilimnocola floriformis TaxID=2948575 RepID=UPI0020C34372|nr:DUF4198 domain-containing protein [Anatilimnocola floriformis]
MNRISGIALALATLIVVGVLGCGSKGAPLAPVTGRVTLDGQPLAGATVCFMREGSPKWSFGQTDADGKFALTTIAENDGAYLGLNQVTVSQPAATSASTAPNRPAVGVPAPDEYFKQLAKSAASQPKLVPEKYQQLGASGLSAEIKAGQNLIDLPLFTATAAAP